MKLDLFVALVLSILSVGFRTSFGCHNIETDQSENDDAPIEDGSKNQDSSDYFADVKVPRRKRSVGDHRDVEIVKYFPGCIQAQLAATPYSSRHWDGPVSYAVYHTKWYEEVDDTICTGQNHTIECWIERLTLFVSGLSPVLLAAQRCVREYTDSTSYRESPVPRYTPGLFFAEGLTCPDVDEDEYEKEFRDSINETESEFELDASVSDFKDVITFTRDDMICFSCDCQDLIEDDDEHSYDFEDGTGCGDCWSTRIALAVRPKSRLRRPAKKATKRRSGLRKKPKPKPTGTPNRNNQGNRNQNEASTTATPAGINGLKGSTPTGVRAGGIGATPIGNAYPRAVYVAPVGMSPTPGEPTDTNVQTGARWPGAIFVAPVGRTNSGSSTEMPSTTRGSNQRQQLEMSGNRQREAQIVQPVQEQQNQHNSPRPQEGSPQNREQRREPSQNPQRQQQPSVHYVQPIRRPGSSNGQTDSSEINQPQRPRDAANIKTTIQPPEDDRKQNANEQQRNKERPSREPNRLRSTTDPTGSRPERPTPQKLPNPSLPSRGGSPRPAIPGGRQMSPPPRPPPLRG